jgi:hypothetical protein
MVDLTEWTGLPPFARQTQHYSDGNPEDRRMSYFAGEASQEPGWQECPNPRAWVCAVAQRLRSRRKREDEAEHISAHRHQIAIVPEEQLRESERHSYNRPGTPINRPETQVMPLPTTVDDAFAALFPSSSASLEEFHAGLDLRKQCQEIGLSEDATRLALARFALPNNRHFLGELLGFDDDHLKAKEQELRRARPALAGRLSAYNLSYKQKIKDF